LGVSAFKGLNLDPERGDLGKFIALAKKDNSPIAKASIFLLEKVDRFSRLPTRKAYAAFCELEETGITIQTLDPEMTIDETNVDNMETVLPVIISMQLAYEQSREKTRRIGAAWQAKRDNARKGKVISRVCPTWLRWNGTKETFVVKPEGKKALLFIFEQSASGIGEKQINYELNKRFKPIGRAKSWHKSFVGWVLNNRQVLGEYQPMTHDDKGERIPEGAAIPNYYPRIISDALFYAANNGRMERRKARGPSTQFINLFSGLVYGEDGFRWQVKTDRAKRKHKAAYVQRRLVSQGHLSHLPGSCPIGYGYWDLEKVVVNALIEIKHDDLETRPKSNDGLLNRKVAELAGIETRIAELDEALTGSKRPVAALVKAIEDMEAKREKVKAAIDQLKREQAAADSQPWEEAKDILELLAAKSGQEEHNLRLKLRGLIALIVDRIVIDPHKINGRVGATIAVKLKSGDAFTVEHKRGQVSYWSDDETRIYKMIGNIRRKVDRKLAQLEKAGLKVKRETIWVTEEEETENL